MNWHSKWQLLATVNHGSSFYHNRFTTKYSNLIRTWAHSSIYFIAHSWCYLRGRSHYIMFISYMIEHKWTGLRKAGKVIMLMIMWACWRHQMDTYSVLLFPLICSRRCGKQLIRRWFETPLRSLRHHSNGLMVSFSLWIVVDAFYHRKITALIQKQ